MNLIENYIKSFLIENNKITDVTNINVLVKKLNYECKKLFNELSSKGDEQHYYNYIFGILDYVAYKNKPRLEELAEGAYRRAYAIEGEDWVLKLSMRKSGAIVNKKEVEISQGKHGLNARDIFIKIYDYDKFSDFPCWIICEKVVPIANIVDLNILKKVFPTFWNIIKDENDVHKKVGFHFKNMICSTLIAFGYYLKSEEPKQAFYSAAEETCYLIDFDDVVFYDDFSRISRAYADVSTEDMSEENFGITSLQNPSPESIVILDFDIT